MNTQPPKYKVESYIPFFAMGGKLTGAHIEDLTVGTADLQDASVTTGKLAVTKLTGTSHATPGTTVTVAHGLAAAPVLQFVTKGNVYITAVDATNVTIASAAASQAFEIAVLS